MRPTRSLTTRITAHLRAEDRAVYDVVEEIKKVFQDLITSLDKPSFTNRYAKDGLPGAAGTGGDKSEHLFDDDQPVLLDNPAGTGERMFHVADQGADRFAVRVFKRLSNPDFDYRPVEVSLDDTAPLNVNQVARTYRGIAETGTTIVRVAGAGTTLGPGPNLIVNGDFSGSTFLSGEPNPSPDHWPTKSDAYTAAPGRDGVTGKSLIIPKGGTVGATGSSMTRAQQASYIGTGSYGCSDLVNKTLAYISLNKNRVYILTFWMCLTDGPGVGNSENIRFSIYGFTDNTSISNTCPASPPTHYGLNAITAAGATSMSPTWGSTTSTLEFNSVPIKATVTNPANWTQYTVTIDTSAANGVGGNVNDPFFITLEFTGAEFTGGGVAAYTSIAEVELREQNVPIGTPTNVVAPWKIRGLANDDWVIEPTVRGSGNSLALDEITGVFSRPTYRPVTDVGASLTVARLQGARFGFVRDGSLANGSDTVTDVASVFIEEPEFGDNRDGLVFGAGAYVTAFRTGAQTASARYRLPLAPPTADDQVLGGKINGNLNWIPASAASGQSVAPVFLNRGSWGSGRRGRMGAPGTAGAEGSIGLQGPRGSRGPAGRTGSMGRPGSDGPTGALGPAGARGLRGTTGRRGLFGSPGATGVQGTQGPLGPRGLRGVPGGRGFPGPTGATGSTGTTGATGATGAAGGVGPPGQRGSIGSRGFPGVSGTPGATGSQGPRGPQGRNGMNFRRIMGTLASVTANVIAKGTGGGQLADSNETDDGTTFSIGKRTALTASSLSFSSAQNDYNVGDVTYLRLAYTGVGFHGDISGLANGTAGRVLVLYNSGSGSKAVNLLHESASSSAANRIVTPIGGTYSISVGQWVTLFYDGTLSRWVVVLTAKVPLVTGGSIGTLAKYTSPGGNGVELGNSYVSDDATTTILSGPDGLNIVSGKLTKILGYDGLATAGKGLVPIHDVVSLISQSSDVSATTFPSVDDGMGGGTASGLYRINVLLEVVSGGVGSIIGRIIATGNGGPRQWDTSSLSLVSGAVTATFFIFAAPNTVISYETRTTGVGGGAFDFFATLEKLSD